MAKEAPVFRPLPARDASGAPAAGSGRLASLRRYSWSSIAAGGVVGLLAVMTLVILGLVGASTVEPRARLIRPAQSESGVSDVARTLGEPVIADSALGREEIASSLVGRGTMSREEAERTVSDWEKIYSASDPAPAAVTELHSARLSEEDEGSGARAAIWISIALLAGAAAVALRGASRKAIDRYSTA